MVGRILYPCSVAPSGKTDETFPALTCGGGVLPIAWRGGECVRASPEQQWFKREWGVEEIMEVF